VNFVKCLVFSLSIVNNKPEMNMYRDCSRYDRSPRDVTYWKKVVCANAIGGVVRD